MKQVLSGALLGALTLVTLAGCDTRQAIGTGLDNVAPAIAISVPGNAGDTVDVSQPVQVHVSANDNLSLKTISLQVVSGATTLTIDTVFTSATPKFDQIMTLPLSGVIAGQLITVSGVAQDGAGNFSQVAKLTLVAADLTAPTVALVAPTGGTYKAGAPLSISVQAQHASGIAVVGYQILVISGTGLETIYANDSARISNAPTSVTHTFAATVPDTLQPGQYLLRGYAADVSGTRAVSSTVTFTVQDAIKPGIDLTSPPLDTNVTLGTNIIAVAHLTDNVGVARLSIVGIATRGDPNLGVVDTVVRFDSVFAPVNVSAQPRSFRVGLRDTTVMRLLTPKNPSDSTTEPVYFVARVTDVAGNDSTVVRRIQLVSGPNIVVLRPGNGAIASPGKSIVVDLRAGDKDGVRTLGYYVRSTSWNITRTAPSPTSPPDTLEYIDTLTVPSTFATPGSFTIVPFATDGVGQPGAGNAVVVQVQAPAADNQGPLVYQTITPRIELDDSVTIRAIDPSGVQHLGFILRDEATGATLLTRDSVVGGTFTDVTVRLPLTVPVTYEGMKVTIESYAYDVAGNVGYSIPASATFPQSSQAAGLLDSVLVVYGRTYALPSGGTAADLAVDTLRRNVFVSNITFDRLETWVNDSGKFSAKKIAVGADPWGLFIDNSSDTLLVANSGGTNLSRVYIGSSDVTNDNEVGTRRIKTPNAVIYDVTVSGTSALEHYDVKIFDFSDRPQFVAQSTTGEIYYSTKPTPSAPDGTIRHYDPTFPAPEAQIIWQYGTGGNIGHVAVINADSIIVELSGSATVADVIYVCDHPYGSTSPSQCYGNTDLFSAISAAQAAGSDVVGVSELQVPSLSLTDTTFVAAGGDRRWVAFGEGHTGGAPGRIMMVQDPGNFFSPATYVTDLTNNASDDVFGLAINKNSSLVGAHGVESYFADIENPFHLRLQGKFNTFQTGAGIAFHPDNDGTGGTSLDDPSRVAFVASSNGTIEIVDSFHYCERGALPVRANLYGPIRVTHAFPGDDPAVILKLFGLTTEGLVVIDVRASDIKPLSACGL